MAKININNNLSKKIYKDTNILIEPKNYNIDKDVCIESPSTLKGVNLSMPFKLGAFTHINPNGLIQNCTIGRYCSIATGVKIGNGNHPTDWLSVNACQYLKRFHDYDKLFGDKIHHKVFEPYKHTIIGNDVWIGANVYIKDGVTIGDGAIIGANSVVTHDVEPYAVVAGCPAKLIRYRFKPEIIKELLELQWWNYSIADFGDTDFANIEKAIEQLKIKLPVLEKYEPQKIDVSFFRRYFPLAPYKKQFFGLFETCIDEEYKYKYFCKLLIYKTKRKKGQ